ncbi:M48 family metallopeptidase [Halobaculum lipolyticum]|uniref:M48 family metallopeptidase n=1 Tax=Halobaculum lipolyticum TaxID=3032001 RepID=A0ABD5WHD9_9EURY|nr:SprT family zinc-dependent metalloprotease [Halobaculum sp. DT31]
MTAARSRTIDLAGDTVEYTVRESTRAERARIDVGLGGVTVVVPEESGVDPAAVLSNHAEWVRDHAAEAAARRADLPTRRFEPGATFPYLGEPHEVVVETRPYSVVDDGALRLAAHHVDDTSVKRALETLYRRTARDRFERLAEEYAPAVGVDYGRIEVRNQRTKWGSCSTTGTISLNWRLQLAPPAIGEYVVVHELAHRRELNHSPAFWAIVAEHDPEYERHREWLAEEGGRLIFSEDDL